MKRLLPPLVLAALLAAVLTGCGAAPSGGASVSSIGHPPPTTPTTRLAISYPIRTGMGSHAHAVRACPAGATCSYTPIGTTSQGSQIFVPVVHLRLTCSPAGGTYRDPAAACRALFDLRHRMRIHHQVCMCPMILSNARSLIRGTLDGTDTTLDLEACALCGLGSAAAADANTLMPGAFTS